MTVLQSLKAHLTAWIDYPEEDVPELSDEHLLKTLGGQKAELDSLIRGYGAGAVLRRGVDCAAGPTWQKYAAEPDGRF